LIQWLPLLSMLLDEAHLSDLTQKITGAESVPCIYVVRLRELRRRNDMKKLICNRAHVCAKRETCKHAVQHDPTLGTRGCGPAMPCSDDPTGAISACVPVADDGTYQTHHRETCPHCQGRGYHVRTETRTARTDAAT
jgi:hypothetical protein